ncbi:MAG: DNA-directed RNA polymerase subunit omega [Alphaproteobacteria bacterium]|jgi:DNA-directed RNA polymerase subunit omega
MARITVEDCVLQVPNRFDLVLIAAQRGRDISSGGALTLDRDNDKNPVVSLREIGEKTVDTEELRQAIILGLQRHVEQDEPEDEDPDMLTLGEGLGAMKPEDALARKSLIEEEIANEVLTVGGDAIEDGAAIDDSDITDEGEETPGDVDMGAETPSDADAAAPRED